MLSGVPNSAFTVGYTNSSWTLKARPGLQRVCRCGVSGASSHLQPSPGRLGLRVRLPHPQLHGRGRVYSPGAAQRLESVASEETALCSVQLGPGAAAQPAHAKRQPRPAPPERTRPTGLDFSQLAPPTRGAASRPGDGAARPARLWGRLHPAVHRRAAQAGRGVAVAAAHELRRRRALHPTRGAGRLGDGVSPTARQARLTRDRARDDARATRGPGLWTDRARGRLSSQCTSRLPGEYTRSLYPHIRAGRSCRAAPRRESHAALAGESADLLEL